MSSGAGVTESADGLDRPSTRAFSHAGWPARPAHRLPAWLRLAHLFLASRRVLTCLVILVAGAVVLRVALQWLPRTGTLSRQIPLTVEAAAAAAIGVTTRSPFGETERAAGRWLPSLRLAAVLVTTGAALGLLAAAVAARHLAGGFLDLLRDLGGFTGIALLAATVAGGGLAWIGPLAYLAVAIPAIEEGWTTPWVWPARPPHDHGAAICAAVAFAAGVAVHMWLGPHSSPD